ncbi:polyhydroxyalkanoic acid system family protein [Propionivibrio sp.]|uniref:polyhydroxyalkanoic acid system family protein n=1 Tax=Propionivibrio sp. TaxID=2212460 RepID=UPI0026183749|nr:polyhydroxyalkanoic acid system family protein [Propionivibrio sp.]
MSDITIRRKHGKSPADARAAAENMASELKQAFDLNYFWDGEVMHFKRPGVSGELTLDSEDIALCIRLSLLLSMLKPSIEREVHKFFDENFQV